MFYSLQVIRRLLSMDRLAFANGAHFSYNTILTSDRRQKLCFHTIHHTQILFEMQHMICANSLMRIFSQFHVFIIHINSSVCMRSWIHLYSTVSDWSDQFQYTFFSIYFVEWIHFQCCKMVNLFSLSNLVKCACPLPRFIEEHIIVS